jgi:tetratricopeptide (TPR) repeat protein
LTRYISKKVGNHSNLFHFFFNLNQIVFTMKTALLSLLLLALTLPVSAQKNKKDTPAPAVEEKSGTDEQFKFYRSLYEQGLQYNDLNVATDAMHSMIALQPGKTELLDSLALLYFHRNAWAQCALVSTDALKKNPEKASLLELRAVSYQSLGMPIESLEDFEKLYQLGKNPYHLYEIATLQYSIKRFGECEVSVTKLMNDPEIKDKNIALGGGDNRQEVPLLAAALNIRGVLDLEQGKKDSAKTWFETALKMKPDFILAKNNLAVAEK